MGSMESPEEINERFNEIAEADLFDISGAEERIQAMATDKRLVQVVYDEIIAEIEAVFVFDGNKPREECEKNFDDAKECVVTLAVQLQHEYGLSDEDTLKAIELARLDIQVGRQVRD